MTGGNISLLGDLGKPAEALINRISDAIGGIAKPWQIKRVAKAEAEAEIESAIIKAEGHKKISELQERALIRLAHEEARKQENIESISYKAIPHLNEHSSPEELDQDWIASFFEQARNVSNEEVQQIWARILAAEATKKNTVPISTLSILKNLGISEAKSFEALLRLSRQIGDLPVPIIKAATDDIVKRQGLDFDQISHLQDLGLINFNSLSGFLVEFNADFINFTLSGKNVQIVADRNRLPIGSVRLTFAGRQIARCLPVEPDYMLDEYIRDYWEQSGVKISEIADPAFNVNIKVEKKNTFL